VRELLRGLTTALRTLTTLRVPGRDATDFASALPWFPLAGGLLGAALFGAAWCTGTGIQWPEAGAVVVLALGFFLTGGLHADGLADAADGLLGTRDREKALRIMKDPTVGAFGVVALICVFLAKWVCLVRLLEHGAGVWIVVAYVVSRTVQVDLAVSQPYARAEGGKAAGFVQGAAPRHVAIALALAAILLGALPSVRRMALVALVLGLLLERWFGIRCRRRLGGITGDMLGACSEVVEAAVLAFGALVSVS
jgi:adenosylcobinamide-GDP ribazoletransferase